MGETLKDWFISGVFQKMKAEDERFDRSTGMEYSNVYEGPKETKMVTFKMADPWLSTCLPDSTGRLSTFEDNFTDSRVLPDSEQYLQSLEAKLERLKNSRKLKKKDLLDSLSQTKQSHLERLVSSNSSVTLNDIDIDQPVETTNLYRILAPEKQATNISELLELVKYDQLGKLFEELENKKTTEKN